MTLWDPGSLATKPIAWFDAAETSTLALSGSDVTTWTCRQTGIVLALDAGATNATYSATGLDGSRPTIDCSASRYVAALSATNNSANYSYFVVVKPDAVAQPDFGFGQISSLSATGTTVWNDGHNLVAMAQNGPAPVIATAWSLSAGENSDGYSTSAANIHYGASRDVANQVASRLNGGTQRTRSAAQTTGQTHVMVAGDCTDDNYEFAGLISEVIWLPFEPTTDEREQIEGYLAWKWGIQSLLPATHTYLNSPPTITTDSPVGQCVF